jgi:hypothetical protein
MDETMVGDGRLAELRTSARGWHGVQLAVLGFIGLCAVLQGQADSPAPRALPFRVDGERQRMREDRAASPGVLAVQSSTQRVVLWLDSVVAISPVDDCG